MGKLLIEIYDLCICIFFVGSLTCLAIKFIVALLNIILCLYPLDKKLWSMFLMPPILTESAFFSGLERDTEYEFSVMSFNDIGESSYISGIKAKTKGQSSFVNDSLFIMHLSQSWFCIFVIFSGKKWLGYKDILIPFKWNSSHIRLGSMKLQSADI